MGDKGKTLFLLLFFVGIIGVGVILLMSGYIGMPGMSINNGRFAGQSNDANRTIQISTDAFFSGEKIPSKYTCDGANINPYLQISQVPVNAKYLHLILVDKDAPKVPFYHWVVINSDAKSTIIDENSIPKNGEIMTNDFGSTIYSGPCPSDEEHTYRLYVYATVTEIDKSQFESTPMLYEYLEKNSLASGVLLGKYAR